MRLSAARALQMEHEHIDINEPMLDVGDLFLPAAASHVITSSEAVAQKVRSLTFPGVKIRNISRNARQAAAVDCCMLDTDWYCI